MKLFGNSRTARGFTLAATMMLTIPLGAQGRQVVVIDPGHGGEEAGVTLPGLLEKDLMLEVGMVIGAEFAKAGFDVVFTRTGDVAVAWPDRRAIAEDAGAVALIMLHAMGKDDTSIKGGELYLDVEASHSAALTDEVASALRGLGSEITVIAKPWPFLKSPTVPTVMAELAHLSNPAELGKLRDPAYQHKLGAALVAAVAATVGSAGAAP